MKPYRNTGRPLRATFAPETRFNLAVTPAAPFLATEPNEFERLKDRLLRDLLAGEDEPELLAPLRRAANDAAALAWAQPFPLLLLPELLREKATTARRYARKQATLRRREPAVAAAEVAA